MGIFKGLIKTATNIALLPVAVAVDIVKVVSTDNLNNLETNKVIKQAGNGVVETVDTLLGMGE